MKRGGLQLEGRPLLALRRLLLGILLAAIIVGSAGMVASTQADISAIVERVKPAVVEIETDEGQVHYNLGWGDSHCLPCR